MKKKLCLLLCAVLCLLPLGACQGEDPAEGALPQPPGLTVTCGEESVTAALGSFQWEYPQEDGTTVAVVSDAVHPLDREGDLPELAGGSQATLSWDGPGPETVVLCCWPEDAGGDTDREAVEVPVDGDSFALLAGLHIYEVRAEWPEGQASGSGDASYAFTARGEEGETDVQGPPSLTLVQGEERTEAYRNFFYWEENGVCVNRTLSAPSGWEVPSVQAGVPVTLAWEREPDEVTLQRWPQGVPDEEAQGEDLPWEGSLTPEAGWVYVLYADWEVQDSWGGTGVYAFCAGE